MVGTSKEGALLKSLGVQGLPSVQGAMIQDVFDPIAIWDEPLFSHQVFKFILMKLGKVLPFEDMISWQPGNSNLALWRT